MRFGRKTSFAAGAIVALVIGSGSAYAATGGKLVLGYGNSAGKTTTLTNGNGTAMTFNSKAGTPSIRVNRNTKVPNLNSDLLDGLDQTKFALAGGATAPRKATGTPVDQDGDTVNDFTVAVAGCPAGTKMTGGGGADYTNDGFPIYNAPNNASSWAFVVGTTATDGTQVEAYVMCYNPRGGVASNFRVAATQPSPELLAKVGQRFN